MKRYFLALTISLFINLALLFAGLFVSSFEFTTTSFPKEQVTTISLEQVALKKVETKKKKSLTKAKKRVVKKSINKPIKKVKTKRKVIKKAVQKKAIVKNIKKQTPKVVKKTSKSVVKAKEVVQKQELKQKVVESKVQELQKAQVKKEIKKQVKKEAIVQNKPSKEQEKKLFLSTNFKSIQNAITKEIFYPRLARRQNIQGEVYATFTLTKEGRVENFKFNNSASILQKAAKKTILKAALNFPKPKHNILIQVPIVYNLL